MFPSYKTLWLYYKLPGDFPLELNCWLHRKALRPGIGYQNFRRQERDYDGMVKMGVVVKNKYYPQLQSYVNG